MGKALSYGLEMIGTGSPLQKEDSELVRKIGELDQLAEKQASILTTREKEHLKALRLWSQGYTYVHISISCS